MDIVKRITTLLFFVSAIGCASSTVYSNRAQNYDREPERLYVVLRSEWFPPQFDDGFANGFKSVMDGCGVATTVGTVSKLELDERAHEKKASAFSADTILVVLPNGGTKGQYGEMLTAVYDAKLHDVESGTVVWRASANLHPGWASMDEIGKQLSASIVSKLVDDRIVRSCQAPTG